MSDNYELPANFYPPSTPETETFAAETPVPETPVPESTGSGTGTDGGTVDVAKDQAGQLKDHALESGSQVAGAAKDAASDVVGEAKTQAKDLLQQTQSELKDQAATQQKRVAAGLRSIADELGDMSTSSQSGGVASDLVGQVSARANSAAKWLDDRDPGSLLHEVRSYAARRPGTFIAIAAIAGLAAGRLTKNLASGAADQKAADKAADDRAAATPDYSATDYTTPDYSAGTASYTQAPLLTTEPVAETVYPATPVADEPVYLGDEFGGAPVEEPIYGDRS